MKILRPLATSFAFFTIVLAAALLAACLPYQTDNRATFATAAPTADRVTLPSFERSVTQPDAGSASAIPTKRDVAAETDVAFGQEGYALYELPERWRSGRPHTVSVARLPSAFVERVVDGDTLIVRFDGQRDRLRMLGINAPESSSNPDLNRQTDEGDIVSDMVKELLTGQTIRLEFDQAPRDQYGRLLAYVWLDEHTMLNENLVFSGLVTVVRFPPNTAYYDHFKSLNREARERKLGFYADVWR